MLSLLRTRWRPLVIVWIVAVVIVAIRLAVMQDEYTSSVLLTPLPLEQVEQRVQSGLADASIRGLLNAGHRRDDYAVAAFLQSRQLLDAVIDELDLGPQLFPQRWDEAKSKWAESGGRPTGGQLRRKLARFVDTYYEEFTGLLTIEVHWGDPARAHRVASGFVEVADRLLRDAAIGEGERRVDELQREMEQVAFGEIDVFLAEEMTRAISSLTSIRARARYAFRVIDPPVVPDRPSWPPRLLLFLLAGLAVAACEVGVVAGIRLRRERSRGVTALGA